MCCGAATSPEEAAGRCWSLLVASGCARVAQQSRSNCRSVQRLPCGCSVVAPAHGRRWGEARSPKRRTGCPHTPTFRTPQRTPQMLHRTKSSCVGCARVYLIFDTSSIYFTYSSDLRRTAYTNLQYQSLEIYQEKKASRLVCASVFSRNSG